MAHEVCRHPFTPYSPADHALEAGQRFRIGHFSFCQPADGEAYWLIWVYVTRFFTNHAFRSPNCTVFNRPAQQHLSIVDRSRAGNDEFASLTGEITRFGNAPLEIKVIRIGAIYQVIRRQVVGEGGNPLPCSLTVG